MDEPSFTCHKCGMVSHNPNDIKERYCGNCHEFQPIGGAVSSYYTHGWLIYSHEHKGYWKQDKRGYDKTGEDAGVFGLVEACDICKAANIGNRGEPEESMVHVSSVSPLFNFLTSGGLDRLEESIKENK